MTGSVQAGAMATDLRVRFPKRSAFHDDLNRRVDGYFASRGHSRHGGWRMGVPGGSSAGLERDTGAAHACRLGCLEQGINANHAGKVLGRSFAGRL